MEVNVKMEMFNDYEGDADDPGSIEEEWGERRVEEGVCEREMIVPDIKKEPHDVSTHYYNYYY